MLSGFNDLATVNPSIAAQWHPVKNLPNTPGATLSGSHKKAWWLCGEGHEWEASVKSRAVGNTGCPYCSNQKVLKGYNDLESRCPDIAAMWNGEKNGDLRPDQVTLGSGKQVWWKCSEGHEWEAQIYRMIQKPRCPICRRTSKVSTQSRPDA